MLRAFVALLVAHVHKCEQVCTHVQDTGEAKPSLEDRFAEMVNNYADAYQLLLRQIILNWKVLSPGIKPRALLVGAQHLLLLPQQDDNWTGCVVYVAHVH